MGILSKFFKQKEDVQEIVEVEPESKTEPKKNFYDCDSPDVLELVESEPKLKLFNELMKNLNNENDSKLICSKLNENVLEDATDGYNLLFIRNNIKFEIDIMRKYVYYGYSSNSERIYFIIRQYCENILFDTINYYTSDGTYIMAQYNKITTHYYNISKKAENERIDKMINALHSGECKIEGAAINEE